MLKYAFNSQLDLQLSAGANDNSGRGQPLALARIALSYEGLSLLDGPARDVKTRATSGSGSYATPGGGFLRLGMSIEQADPDQIAFNVTITNIGQVPVQFDHFSAPKLQLDPQTFDVQARLWTMQGAAVHWGQDFAFQLKPGFRRENFLGHLQNAEGGGIPVVYFWNQFNGLALMHIETEPKDWYMPVAAGQNEIYSALELRQLVTLQPGESFQGLKTIISWHRSDFFAPLALYRELLAAEGLAAPEPVPANFEPGWCSWGYEFDVLPDEMSGVLPVLRELGIKWVTLDDRWFDAYADWNPRADTFPGGAADMQRMNDQIHAAGGFSQIWWYPLCVEDGYGKWESHVYEQAQLFKEHPDWLVLNADGSVARNNRHLAMLCPALPEVQEHLRELTLRFIRDWGFDGHKLDNIYSMPACHNPAHQHIRPEESTEAFAAAYRIIFETTRQLRPDSITQICPCGTPLTFSLLPYTDQTVTADPTSSLQIRQRIKFYKALSGPRTAVFADHVELSDGGVDFASEIGAGGVPATKFIWPDDDHVRSRLKEVWTLPEEKKVIWKKWFELYNTYRPAEGEYLNLYDLALDTPETHLIKKDGDLYYAFYAAQFKGRLELRGLEQRTYQVLDYVHQRALGSLNGADPWLEAQFEGSLLLRLAPE
jgi:alpha-galactosidase